MSSSGSKIKTVSGIVLFILLAAVLFLTAQALLMPKYTDFPGEGNLTAEYYSSSTRGQHDVIFLGDCEFYETINPAVLWNENGISSYVRGSSQQLIWDSYYFLEETLKYEKPSVVVFNAIEMKIGEVQSEAYTRLTLDGMRLSKYKIAAVRESLTEGETLASYIFPILRYHGRWTELTADDFRHIFSRDKVSVNGYIPMTGIEPKTVFLEGDPKLDYSFPDICWDYLDRIRLLCEEQGIELVLFKAPAQSWKYWWYPEWEKYMDDYAAEHGLLFISGPELQDEMGLDWNSDSYDGGVHLNWLGAEKVSRYLSGVLASQCGVPDRRSDTELAGKWEKIVNEYNAARAEAEKIN